jgi:Rhodanese-related sulfurtransferase
MIHKNINTDSFKKKTAEHGHILLDVRTYDEFNNGHIKNAVNIDFYKPDFPNELKKLGKEKSYLIYCRSGNRSEVAMHIMKQLGFKEVYNLGDGINGWAHAGFEIEI